MERNAKFGFLEVALIYNQSNEKIIIKSQFLSTLPANSLLF
jgi:hypothetical protein